MAGGAKIEGLDGVLRRLRGLGEKVRKKAAKQAVTQAGRTVLWEAKAQVRKATGLLRKSLGQKVKVFRDTGSAVAMVGPRVGFKIPLPPRTRGKKAGEVVYANPTQYSHLVEKGTRRSQAFPFLSSALESKKGQILKSMANVIANAIEDAAKGGS